MEESDDEASQELLNQIRVVVRVRPVLQGESVLQKRAVTNTSGQMDLDCRQGLVNLRYDFKNKETKTFKFDKVCDGTLGQKDFYNAIGVRGMVSQVVNGYHATVFAYGQTGAGKTYTMEGYKYVQNEKGKYEPQIEQAISQGTVGIVQRCAA